MKVNLSGLSAFRYPLRIFRRDRTGFGPFFAAPAKKSVFKSVPFCSEINHRRRRLDVMRAQTVRVGALVGNEEEVSRLDAVSPTRVPPDVTASCKSIP